MGDVDDIQMGGAGGPGYDRTQGVPAIARALGVSDRFVQQWCKGRGGKSTWSRPCPHSVGPRKRLLLNEQEVRIWCRSQGLEAGDYKANAFGDDALPTLPVSDDSPDLFTSAGGTTVMSGADAARRLMGMFEELSALQQKLMASMAGHKGVNLNTEAKQRLSDALEGRGVTVNATSLAAAVEEAGLFLGPPVVVDVSGSLLNSLAQAIAKFEGSARMQQKAHQEELERRGTTMDRESAVRIVSQAAGRVRSQLAAAGVQLTRCALEAVAGGGLVFARVTHAEAKEGEEAADVVTVVSEVEMERVVLVQLERVVAGLAERCATELDRAAEDIVRRAAAEGRAA